MKSNHALKIATELKGLTFKTLLARLCIYALTAGLIVLFAWGAISPIINSTLFREDVSALIKSLKTLVLEFLNPETLEPSITAETINANVSAVTMHIYDNLSGIIWALIAIFLVWQLAVFLSSICDYTIAVNINNHMSSLIKTKFFLPLIENFKGACKYGLYMVVMLLIYNTVVISICYLFGLIFIKTFGLLALSLILFTFVSTFSIRFALIGHVLPKMICEDKKPLTAFRECFKDLKGKGNLFFERFGEYFFMIIIVFVINALSAFVTFYVSLLVTVPLTIIIFKTLKFVGYYTENKKKYFINYDEIYVPKELRKNDENLLNEVDI